MNRSYCNGMVHVIRPGETLYQLSRKYRVPLALLLRANPYVDVYNLQEGQEICIPMVRPNGMICVPAQNFVPQENMTQEEMTQEGMMQEGMSQDNVSEERQIYSEENKNADVQQNMTSQHKREEENSYRQENTMPIQQMNDAAQNDDVEIYVTSGGKSLGDIMNEHEVNWEEFVRNNNLNQIVLEEDVVLYFPKHNQN